MACCRFALILMGVACAARSGLFAEEPLPLWNGKPVDVQESSTPANEAAQPVRPPMPARPREPEWLRRMDRNDRATLTGGWKLQNWSGGVQSLTTAGDRRGQYAPNTYQGRSFQSWNNVSNRQEIASWNAGVPTFPRQQWSRGYVSPNTYFGADAQRWGNLSAGQPTPNTLSGGWRWR